MYALTKFSSSASFRTSDQVISVDYHAATKKTVDGSSGNPHVASKRVKPLSPLK